MAVPLSVLWPLTRRWYRGRLDPDYARPGPAVLQSWLADAGLTADFWSLGVSPDAAGPSVSD